MFKIWSLALLAKWLKHCFVLKKLLCLAINQEDILSRRKTVSGLKVLG